MPSSTKPCQSVPVRRLDDLHDGQVELRGELEVARVVPGHGHDGAGAVADQHVIGDPDGDLLAVDRVDGVGAGEHAGLLLGQFGAFEVGLLGDLGFVSLDCRALRRGGDELHQLVLGRQHHVGGAEQRVRPGGEDADACVAARRSAPIRNCKVHLRAFAAADPVPLHFLERIAPVDGVEVLQQPLGVGGDAQHPLAHRLADDREAADLALAVHDLLVGQHGAELLAPPDRASVT